MRLNLEPKSKPNSEINKILKECDFFEYFSSNSFFY